MTTPIPLFVELCAGTAAVSLRLHRDGAKPPVSRMGGKTGYAAAILRILGLIPGQRADRCLWCEPDPGVRLLLHAYRDAGLAKAAAAIIRGWAAEDPRALWERLRAEGPPRLPEGPVDAGEVARWAWVHNRTMPQAQARGAGDGDFNGGKVASDAGLAAQVQRLAGLPATITPDARHIDPREVARVIQIIASNELINVAWSDAEGRWKNTGKGGTTFGGPIGYGADRSPAKMDGLPEMPAVVVPDAREVDPREVARHLCGSYLSYGQRLEKGFRSTAGGAWPDTPPDVTTQAERLEVLPHIDSALIHPDARDIDPPALPPGTVAYMDPSYVGTTGYADNLGRAEVVMLARRWAAAGATVAISEAEAIPELVAEGWFAVEITNERIGQARTFSRQKSEWVTLNRPSAWTPSVQGSLF